MNRLKELLGKINPSMTFAACSAVILYLALIHIPEFLNALGALWGYFRPIVTGIIVAYIMSPLVGLYEKGLRKSIFRKKTSCKAAHGIAIMLTVLTVLIGLAVLLIALIPQLVDSVVTFVSNLDSYAESLEQLLATFSGNAGTINLDISAVTNWMSGQVAAFARDLPENAQTIADISSDVGGGIFSGVVGCILAIYFLSDSDRLLGGLKGFLKLVIPAEKYESSGIFWRKCNEILLRFIGCDLLDGLVVGVVNFIFMLIMGMPYGVMISVVIGVTNLAPTFGPILGAAIGGFILLLADPIMALVFLIFTVILQTLDGYILKPKLFGATLNVPSVWILITIVVGGRMFGVPGIMLAIPFAAIVNYIYQDAVVPKLKSAAEEYPDSRT